MLIDNYVNYQSIYKDKYGDKTIILMQVGSFYELYSINPEANELHKIADICNIQISRKNKLITEISKNNPYMCGFPLYVLNKYVQLLIQNNYTIVLIEQITEPPNPERKITEIISPSININYTNKKSNYIITLFFDYDYINNFIIVGISGVDLSTGQCFIYEVGSNKNDPLFAMDECYRIITSYNPCELLILSDHKLKDNIKDDILNSLNINDILVHYKWDEYEYLNIMKKPIYQLEILEKSYKKSSMLNIIEYLNLEKLNIARISFCCSLQFAFEHNADIIKELNIPNIIENNNILNIEYNSALQLNILSLNNNEKPLLDILNRCSTAFGNRNFKERLLNPLIDIEKINKRYDDISYLLTSNKFKDLYKILNNIIDLERVKRRLLLNKFNPMDWCSFDTSLEYSIEAFKIINNDNLINIINNIKKEYSILNLENCNKYNLIDIKGNIFNKGVNSQLDELDNNYKTAYNNIIDIVNIISSINDSSCKIDYNEREGYYISITKKRYENALKTNKKYMSQFEKKILSSSSNILKLTSKDINNFSNIIEKNQLMISSLVLKEYQLFITSFINNNKNNLEIIIDNLINLDISCCNARNAYDFRYYKPDIDNEIGTSSYIKAENLRHPIIENINKNIEYIGNDIELNENGIILYGINSSGKSSLMKAVGLNLIMAQSGMFVPSIHFKYRPYKHIMTRITGNDNIYKGMSSFVVEMTELRNILQRSNNNSLIIGDEICNGTEATSGVCIIASCINELIKKKASFIFTSHLHELININLIKNEINKKIKIYHMHITINDNKIIYERKLKDGNGSSLYGIEVCKSLDMPLDFMKNAEMIRKELEGIDKSLINTKKSIYNNDLIMGICNVCKINPSIETHHINYQSLSDKDGFFENFHKNNKHNLVQLCNECHKKEHNGIISINGYKQTSEGIELDINNDIMLKLDKYIKKGKLNWFYRKQKNGKFKIGTEEDILLLINKLTNKNYKKITNDLHNILYDPSY